MPTLSWIQIVAGATGAFALSWLLHTVDIDRLEREKTQAISSQEVSDKKSCDNDKLLTKEANDELQKDRDSIAAKLVIAKRLHSAVCVVPASKLANNTAGGSQYARRNGVSSDWLRNYAAECESYRSEVITLNNFGLAERK